MVLFRYQTFDTIPAIDGTEFTAVQGKEAKDKTRSEVKQLALL